MVGEAIPSLLLNSKAILLGPKLSDSQGKWEYEMLMSSLYHPAHWLQIKIQVHENRSVHGEEGTLEPNPISPTASIIQYALGFPGT